MSRNAHGFYQGCNVSDKFMERWRSLEHIGSASPFQEVWVRRGRLIRSFHNNWPDPQFGRIFGESIRHQWYPVWTPLDEWTQLLGVEEVDLDQNFSNNGSTTATITADNLQWLPKTGPGGPYHARQRGYLWPWYGYVPPTRPGGVGKGANQWFLRLPNAQILIRQGYGPDTAIKTFTGLIDTLDGSLHPDRVQIAARDFGSVLTDSHVFGWNKTKGIHDPITFVPFDWAQKHKGIGVDAMKKHHRWIVVKDATDVVRVVLRWCGFTEWQIENSGVELSVPYTVDKTKTMMDIINDIATALGYIFFIAEPTDGPLGIGQPNDASIGKPIFRRPSAIVPSRSLPLMLHQNQLLTDLKPKRSNQDERYIIRVRGQVNKKIGRAVGGDTFKRVTFTYWPPWIRYMAGVIKQLTYYNVGDKGVLGFQTVQQCMVACLLIAFQIALSRDTCVAQAPGQPGFGLDSFAFLDDAGSGVSGRLYITNRKSVMKLGGEGAAGHGGSSGELLWSTEIGGSLIDNRDFDKITSDYQKALAGKKVVSWSPVGWD